jgi:hypothetical protein
MLLLSLDCYKLIPLSHLAASFLAKTVRIFSLVYFEIIRILFREKRRIDLSFFMWAKLGFGCSVIELL